MLGDEGTQELHALKRMSFSDRATARLSFTAASPASMSNLHLYLVRPDPPPVHTQPAASVLALLLSACTHPQHRSRLLAFSRRALAQAMMTHCR